MLSRVRRLLARPRPLSTPTRTEATPPSGAAIAHGGSDDGLSGRLAIAGPAGIARTDTVPQDATLVVEGGTATRRLADVVAAIAPRLILEDRSSPERPLAATSAPWQTRSLGTTVAPEYSPREAHNIAAATRAAGAFLKALGARLESSGSTVPTSLYVEPAAAHLAQQLGDRLAVRSLDAALAGDASEGPLVLGWTDGRIGAPLLRDRARRSAEASPSTPTPGAAALTVVDCRLEEASEVPFDDVLRRALDDTGSVPARPAAADGPIDASALAAYFSALGTAVPAFDASGRHLAVVSDPDPSGNLLFTAERMLARLSRNRPALVLSIGKRGASLAALSAAVDRVTRGQPDGRIEMVELEALLADRRDVRRTARAAAPSLTVIAFEIADRIPLDGADAPLSVVAGDLIERFATGTLPRLMLAAATVHAAFSEAPPSGVSYFRSRPPLVRVVAHAARHAGISGVDVNPTSLSDWAGHREPLGDRIAVPDRRGIDALTRRFALPSERVVPVGSVRIADAAERTAPYSKDGLRDGLGVPRGPAPLLLFCPSHGRPTVYGELLALLLARIETRPGSFLLVKPHPKDGEREIGPYRQIVDRAATRERTRLDPRIDTYAAMVAADVMVTAFSTSGFEASVLGTPVIAYTGDLGPDAPVGHVMANLPEIVESPSHFASVLDEFLDDGPALSRWRDRRADYVARNPEMTDGRVIERLCDLVTGVS